MNEKRHEDWDPRAAEVVSDQSSAYDRMRQECPIAYSSFLGWSLFRHEDVRRVVEDHETFSNAGSAHLSVPNGMDPPLHAVYRRALEPFFGEAYLREFEPRCREIACRHVQGLQAKADFMASCALPFAAECQCAFLGWPSELSDRMVQWTRSTQAATFEQNRGILGRTALELEALVAESVAARAEDSEPRDVMGALMRLEVEGRPLTRVELTSVLRNWTVGEVGSLAAGLGVIAFYLAKDPELRSRLRSEPELIPDAVEELLRICGPLVANRRTVQKTVRLGEHTFEPGDKVSVMWVSADRDERVFEAPTTPRLDRDRSQSLLWGAGIHVCPGAPLARLELRVALEVLLELRPNFALDPAAKPDAASYPANGFSVLPLNFG